MSMSTDSSALSALQTAAGVSGSDLSLTIRTLLLALVFFWAAACIYSKIQRFRHHDVDMYDTQRTALRILFIVSLVIVLVFVA